MDIQSCPRRMQEMGPWSKDGGQDTWEEQPRQPGELTPRCSFCGSLHPGKFLELVAQGWAVGPTDKTYKVYLHQVFNGPERTAAPGEPLPALEQYTQSKFYFQHLSEAQQRQFIDLYNRQAIHFAKPGYFYVLPFFMQIAR